MDPEMKYEVLYPLNRTSGWFSARDNYAHDALQADSVAISHSSSAMSKALERVQNALKADEQRHAVRLKVGAKAVGCVGYVGYTPNIALKYTENADKPLDLEVPEVPNLPIFRQNQIWIWCGSNSKRYTIYPIPGHFVVNQTLNWEYGRI